MKKERFTVRLNLLHAVFISMHETANRINVLQQELMGAIEIRNGAIRKRYTEMYNINTWYMIKLNYVYSQIAKEFDLKAATVKNIILYKK
ncbi:MAG TPA: hypothetical protein VK658_08770 [Chryseolinea sp.]|nr:hypothetical protein [Chryseolinea sp.]